MPTREYTLPSSEKKDFYEISKEVFLSKINNSITKSILDNFTGISNCFISTLIEKLQISDTNYKNEELSLLYDNINSILSSFGTNKLTCKNVSKKDYTIMLENND